MGLIGKIFWIIIIAVVAIVLYEAWKVDSIQFCVNEEPKVLQATCVTKSDCVNYMTSVYGNYPDTELYQNVLDETTSCRSGKCSIDEFYAADSCPSSTSTLIYKASAKDKVNIWLSKLRLNTEK